MTDYAALCISPTCRPANPRRAQPSAHVCDVCEDKLRSNLYAIENTWDDLQAALMRGNTDPTAERVKGTRAVGLVINETASNARAQASDAIWFLARTVVDERGVKCGGSSVPAVAHWIAFAHVPWIVRHHDPDLVTAVLDDIDRAQRAIHRAAYPSGVRPTSAKLPPCDQHTTDEAGARIKCPGQMTALVGLDVMPDLVCDHDQTHRIEPGVWERQTWKRDARKAMA